MLWFSKRNHWNYRASLKHNTELATKKKKHSHLRRFLFPQWNVKPRVYTDSLKCLWRRSCWFCKYFCCWLGRCCCFNHLHGDRWAYLGFDPAACELFVRLFDTDVFWHLTAVELWDPSVLPGLFLQPATTFFTEFSRFTAELKPSFLQPWRALLSFSQGSLVRLCSRCFWRRCCRLHS